jgi:Domain of unknown function (DUF4252)
MKKLIILTIAVFGMASAYAQSDAITKYFKKYVDDERFDMVYISPKMFELFASMDLAGEGTESEVMDIVKDLKGLQILSFEGDSSDAPGLYKEARSNIDLDGYEELLTARDGNENVHIMVKSEGSIVSELFVLIGGGDEFTMISFVGNIDLKKVGKIARMLDLGGMEHLENLDKE